MKQGKGIGLLVIFLFFTFLQMSGEAQEKKGGAARGFGFITARTPIEITSETVEGEQKQNRVTFKGNVMAKQEETTLHANMLAIYYDPDTKGIKTVVATGNVKIVQLERRATSQKATFHQDENKVVLDGEAVIREGENVIRGERVIYYVDEERSVVEGGKGGRVNATITPPKRD